MFQSNTTIYYTKLCLWCEHNFV